MPPADAPVDGGTSTLATILTFLIGLVTVGGPLLVSVIRKRKGIGKPGGLNDPDADDLPEGTVTVVNAKDGEKHQYMDLGITVSALANRISQLEATNREQATQLAGQETKLAINAMEALANRDRIVVLEMHEGRYQQRIEQLEHWGTWSTDPPPRKPPDWMPYPLTLQRPDSHLGGAPS